MQPDVPLFYTKRRKMLVASNSIKRIMQCAVNNWSRLYCDEVPMDRVRIASMSLCWFVWPSLLGMHIGPIPHHCSPSGRAPVHSSVKTSTWCLPQGKKLQSRQQSALSGVSQAQKAKESRDERPRLRASKSMPPTFIFFLHQIRSRLYCDEVPMNDN